MRIGIDFDNTIVSYNALFFKVAREQDAVPADIPVNKVSVRDYLRKIDKEHIWTEMQGYVYGARMGEALAYPGVIDFLKHANQAGHQLAIVSHKTRFPFLGEQYDLHSAARAWVKSNLYEDGKALIPEDRVFFELTKTDKMNRARALGCDVFIDDLPEILLSPEFPSPTRRVLFDPEMNHTTTPLPAVTVVNSWSDFAQYVHS